MTTLRDVLGTRNRRATRCRTILAGAVTMVGVVGLAPHSARAAAAPSVAVPAYFWSSTQWDRMLVSSDELRYVVLNPDSGPGTVSYPTFVAKVAAARSQGATVVGYVDTSYGTRPPATVKADIDKYRNWYGVNAFFFDQTPYDCAGISYYQDVEDYVRAQAGGFIFHNPGMNPQECYLDVADVVVNFEGSESSYNGWTPAPYVAGYPADRFWHIVYAVDPTHASALLSSAASRNGGLVFLTEQDMPNPFTVIPTEALWSAQTPTRAGRRPAPQASPPSTTAPIPTTTRVAAPQSETPTTSPAGAAAEAPVTIRPAAPVAVAETTTTTVVTGNAQSAPVPVIASAPTIAALTSASVPVVAATIPPVSTLLPSAGASAAAAPIVGVSGDGAFPIVPPAPLAPPAVGTGPFAPTPTAAIGPVPRPAVTSPSPTVSPTGARPPAGPASVPVTPTVGKATVGKATAVGPTRGKAMVVAPTVGKATVGKARVRAVATAATPARRIADVPKKALVAGRPSAR